MAVDMKNMDEFIIRLSEPCNLKGEYIRIYKGNSDDKHIGCINYGFIKDSDEVETGIIYIDKNWESYMIYEVCNMVLDDIEYFGQYEFVSRQELETDLEIDR